MSLYALSYWVERVGRVVRRTEMRFSMFMVFSFGICDVSAFETLRDETLIHSLVE